MRFLAAFNKVTLFHSIIALGILCWSVILLALWLWAHNEERKHFDETVMLKAESLAQHNQKLRRWIGGHGGVYVEVSDEIKPNPLLANVKERDIVTPSGRKLTLLNSPAILREISDQFKSAEGDQMRLVSHNPINPNNYPDDWESKALDQLEDGGGKAQSFVSVGGVSYFRLMYPMNIVPKCMNCHHYAANSPEKVVGGLSVIVDKTPYDRLSEQVLNKIGIGYFSIWVAGLFGLFAFDFFGAQLLRHLEFTSIHDGLTRLNNRREIDRLLNLEYQRATRYQKPLSLMMIDIDHFKQVNDTYGHQVGDKALRLVAETIKQTIRKTDIAGRYGGEELLVIATDTPSQDAISLAQRLSSALCAIPIKIKSGESISITVSIGVSCYSSEIKSASSLVKHADDALYQAKELGRNRVCFF